MKELLDALESAPSRRKKPDNSLQFILYMEMEPSEKAVPFYIIYWYYRKWCMQKEIPANRRVTKHILSRALGLHFKKKSSYPKIKKWGVRVDYQMVVYVSSIYFNLSQEEEEIAFNYYHFYYDKERLSWKRRRKNRRDRNRNTQD